MVRLVNTQRNLHQHVKLVDGFERTWFFDEYVVPLLAY